LAEVIVIDVTGPIMCGEFLFLKGEGRPALLLTVSYKFVIKLREPMTGILYNVKNEGPVRRLRLNTCL